MTPTDDLFRLIKSLTKSEKRYFKLFSGLQKGNKKYVSLFRAIERQESYDENKLKILFSDKTFTNQLSVSKIHLFNLLLKSLSLYHSDRTSDFRIREALNSIEVLFYKGMFEQCLKMIKKQKIIARKAEKCNLLLELLRWERRLLSFDIDNLYLLHNSWLETSAIRKMAARSDEYQQTNLTFWMRFNEKGKTREKEDVSEFHNLFMSLPDEPVDGGWESRWYFWNTHLNYYRATGNYSNAFSAAVNALRTLETVPDLTGEEPHKYITSLSNIAVVLQELGELEECKYYTNKLRNFVTQKNLSFYSQICSRAFILSDNTELEICIRSGLIEEALVLVPLIEEYIEEPFNFTSEYSKLGIYLEITYLFFIAENYKNALFWINKVLARPSIRSDIQPVARLMNILIHYELGNLHTLESVIVSATNFLRTKNRFYEYENSMNMKKRFFAN